MVIFLCNKLVLKIIVVIFFFVFFSYFDSDNFRHNFLEIGQFHLGDLVNVFKHGSLVMKQFQNGYETQLSVQGSIFYGTISGALGL